MPTVGVSALFSGELDHIRAVADKLKVGVPDVMAAVAETIYSHVVESFEMERDPWGKKWGKLRPATVAIYERGGFGYRSKAKTRKGRRNAGARRGARLMSGRRLLMGSGKMRNAIRPKSGKLYARVVMGKHIAYGRVHQYGNLKNRIPNRKTSTVKRVRYRKAQWATRPDGTRRKVRARQRIEYTSTRKNPLAPIQPRPFFPIKRGKVVLPPELHAEIMGMLRDALGLPRNG